VRALLLSDCRCAHWRQSFEPLLKGHVLMLIADDELLEATFSSLLSGLHERALSNGMEEDASAGGERSWCCTSIRQLGATAPSL
jgi:hypothetical protein